MKKKEIEIRYRRKRERERKGLLYVLYNKKTEKGERKRKEQEICAQPPKRQGGYLHKAIIIHTLIFTVMRLGPMRLRPIINVQGERVGYDSSFNEKTPHPHRPSRARRISRDRTASNGIGDISSPGRTQTQRKRREACHPRHRYRVGRQAPAGTRLSRSGRIDRDVSPG